MDIYNFNIAQYNVDQIINEVYLQMNKRLVATYEGQLIDGYFTGYESSVEFGFYINLTIEEQSLLNNIILNYVYNPKYEDDKRFKINNSFEDPRSIDYDIMGFHKKRTITSGELRKVEYFRNYDHLTKTYSDLIVVELREYFRNEIGIAQYRNQTSKWILNDDTEGLVINYSKYYSPEEGIQEGIDRRTNMISSAKISLLNELAIIYGEPANQNYAFDLLTSVKAEIEYFIQGYTQPLRDSINSSTKPYLNSTIKNAILQQLIF